MSNLGSQHNLEAFTEKNLQSPGNLLPCSRPSTSVVSLRVYAEHAIVSPGTAYKSIPVTTTTTAYQVIKRVLEKFGELGNANPRDFELRSVRFNKKTGKAKRRGSFRKLFRSDSDVSITLEPDVSVVMFAEWYSEESRRFELHRKPPAASEMASPTRRRSGLLMSLRKRRSTASQSQLTVAAVSQTATLSPGSSSNSILKKRHHHHRHSRDSTGTVSPSVATANTSRNASNVPSNRSSAILDHGVDNDNSLSVTSRSASSRGSMDSLFDLEGVLVGSDASSPQTSSPALSTQASNAMDHLPEMPSDSFSQHQHQGPHQAQHMTRTSHGVSSPGMRVGASNTNSSSTSQPATSPRHWQFTDNARDQLPSEANAQVHNATKTGPHSASHPLTAVFSASSTNPTSQSGLLSRERNGSIRQFEWDQSADFCAINARIPAHQHQVQPHHSYHQLSQQQSSVPSLPESSSSSSSNGYNQHHTDRQQHHHSQAPSFEGASGPQSQPQHVTYQPMHGSYLHHHYEQEQEQRPRDLSHNARHKGDEADISAIFDDTQDSQSFDGDGSVSDNNSSNSDALEATLVPNNPSIAADASDDEEEEAQVVRAKDQRSKEDAQHASHDDDEDEDDDDDDDMWEDSIDMTVQIGAIKLRDADTSPTSFA